MGLLSFLQRKEAAPESTAPRRKRASATPSPDAVQQARTRARQRLIGAAVLLGIGVIGFPLLFETQPRPIPVDLPIEIPRRESAPPLQLPSARPTSPLSSSASSAASPAAIAPPAAAVTSNAVIDEKPEDAGRERAAVDETVRPEAAAPADSAREDEKKPPTVTAAASRPVAAAAKPAPAASRPSASDASRAKALLEGKPSTADAGRFVVQVGAFGESTAARDARAKVEKLGLKSYTQVVETDGGKRIRVRVGPFASREEAQRAVSKLKSAGLGGNVLTL